MSANDLICTSNLQENVGIPNALKGTTSAKRSLFGSSKKAKVLADVKNTINSKEHGQRNLDPKKLMNNLVFKKEFSSANCSTTKQMSFKAESVAIVTNVIDDEENTPDDDCPYCKNNEEEDYLDIYKWPEEFNLTEESIRRLCLDPNPKSHYYPSPERDINSWYKAIGIPPMSSPSFSPIHDNDNDYSRFKLPADFYNHDEIMPVYY